MLIWRVVNNIDSNRDIYIDLNTICVVGTNKNAHEDFMKNHKEAMSKLTKYLIDKNIIKYDA